jgi:hypothetical protein
MGVLLLGLSGTWALAEPLNRLRIAFSEDRVALLPPPLPPGVKADQVFADWGVTVSTGTVKRPVSGTISVYPGFGDPPYKVDTPVIMNPVVNGEAAGGLIVTFDTPLPRASLTMGAESETMVAAKFFGVDGGLLGEIDKPIDQWNPYDFSLEEAEGTGISRVEVAYEDPTIPEALIRIVADFAEPPTFRRCVSQVAHGALPLEGRTLQTLLTITESWRGSPWNPTFDQLVSLEFREPGGAPLTVNLDGTVNSDFEYIFYAYLHRHQDSRILRTTDSVTPLDQGYVCAASRYPFEMAAVYRVLDQTGAPLAEAGIDSAIPGQSFTGVFEKTIAEDTNTALALANVSPNEATASVTFFMSHNTTFEAEVALGPGEQGAWFADELAEALSGRAAEGTVEIVSDQPIAVTILRTIQGVVSASLPMRRNPIGPAR